MEVIPTACFRDAEMDVEELTIEKAAVGYRAFYGHDVKIGTLNIGNQVTYAEALSYQLGCFEYATIGVLNYNSNAVDPNWATVSHARGMFAYAEIGQLYIGEDVECIPAFWFYSIKLTQETLTIPCNWSFHSFDSSYIKLGTLILNGDVEEIINVSSQNLGFSSIKADTVIYDIPSAVFNGTSTMPFGPFHYAEITNFVITDRVEYLDDKLLRNSEFTNCYIYAVNASEGYLEQTLATVYLPTTEHLHIHYNSDFKTYFDNEVTEYHWLCVDYFDTTYGDKVFDEETGEYVIEIFKTCSVCGYEEQETEQLDSSYDVNLSIPVEIPLTFDKEAKAYIGSEQVYAYGTLGNAYEGLKLVVDRDSENYGMAVMGEKSYPISSYLSVGFQGGEAAVFDREQLLGNQNHVAAGEWDDLYLEQMNVKVDALAFIQGGAGSYRISIPIRMEFVY